MIRDALLILERFRFPVLALFAASVLVGASHGAGTAEHPRTEHFYNATAEAGR